ncbi:hypothetical protein BCY86_06655 [Pajaroellobacter abortibovis]|uniref:Pseudouridine synthase RsuA/RluA-like domain-containing protein n=2 Tax=Pajaroellobacter abortibovis TaxID=1882918 RepID=A0A1L6MXS8_9BACT|nr:hypothetical protein BCY86_06655 [Pajaroellobacter abortibovis]
MYRRPFRGIFSALDQKGEMRVVKQGSKGGQLAVTRVQLTKMINNHTLLTLCSETEGTHQARVQLACRGMPRSRGIVSVGGSLASRLLLHAYHLCIEHPITGKPLIFIAPPEFEDWLIHGP